LGGIVTRRCRCGCEYCGSRGQIAFSERFGRQVCWSCYHASFSAEQVAEAERVEHQQKLGAAIRSAAAKVGDERREMLETRAFLIEVADAADEVLALLDEVERLGVTVSRR
jgi:hypothetical protein